MASDGVSGAPHDARRSPALNLEISKAIVRLISEYTGRGPMKARTTINGSLVACVLEDTLTKGERTLVGRGRADAVMEMRQHYQQAMSQEAIAAVEGLTGRKVLAFMSANHADPDYGVEVFILNGNGDQPSPTAQQ
jgi:uncharacterized protein YbcI